MFLRRRRAKHRTGRRLGLRGRNLPARQQHQSSYPGWHRMQHWRRRLLRQRHHLRQLRPGRLCVEVQFGGIGSGDKSRSCEYLKPQSREAPGQKSGRGTAWDRWIGNPGLTHVGDMCLRFSGLRVLLKLLIAAALAASGGLQGCMEHRKMGITKKNGVRS